MNEWINEFLHTQKMWKFSLYSLEMLLGHSRYIQSEVREGEYLCPHLQPQTGRTEEASFSISHLLNIQHRAQHRMNVQQILQRISKKGKSPKSLRDHSTQLLPFWKYKTETNIQQYSLLNKYLSLGTEHDLGVLGRLPIWMSPLPNIFPSAIVT